MPPKKQSTELEAVEAEIVHDVVKADLVPVERPQDFLSKYLRTQTEADGVPDGAAYQAIIDQIMGSTTLADILADPDTDKPEDLNLRHLTFNGFKFEDSDFPEGPPVYSVVFVYDHIDNVKRIVVTGNQRVMAQLMAIQLGPGFPFDGMFKQGARANKWGKFPISIVEWKE